MQQTPPPSRSGLRTAGQQPATQLLGVVACLQCALANGRANGTSSVLPSHRLMAVGCIPCRRVEAVNISPFIANLPFGKDTTNFHTPDASGSTSQVGACMRWRASLCQAGVSAAGRCLPNSRRRQPSNRFTNIRPAAACPCQQGSLWRLPAGQPTPTHLWQLAPIEVIPQQVEQLGHGAEQEHPAANEGQGGQQAAGSMGWGGTVAGWRAGRLVGRR